MPTRRSARGIWLCPISRPDDPSLGPQLVRELGATAFAAGNHIAAGGEAPARRLVSIRDTLGGALKRHLHAHDHRVLVQPPPNCHCASPMQYGPYTNPAGS